MDLPIQTLGQFDPSPLPRPRVDCALITCQEVPVSAVSFPAADTASSELLLQYRFERLRQSWLKSLCPDIRVDSFFDFYVPKIVNHHE